MEGPSKPQGMVRITVSSGWGGRVVLKMHIPGMSLVAQWLRLRAPSAGGPGSIPGRGTRSHMHAATKSSHATTKEPTCCN